MPNTLPISLEILACFILSTSLLHRYSDMVNNNIITIVGVFISWFFSFMVIFMLPADLTSTAYRQCVQDFQANSNSTSGNLTIRSPAIVNNIDLITEPTSLVDIPQNHHLLEHNNSSNEIKAISLVDSDLQLHANGATNITNPCITPWNYVSDNVLTKLWRFIYWTSQILTWLILPIMQSYSMAGDFTTIDKIKSAVRANLIYYSSFGAIFMVLLIYVIFKNGLDFAGLKVIAISSSNTWGLFLLVVLLGYGLVELPRFIINLSRYSQLLSRQYFRVARLNAEKCEAEEKLDDVLEEIHHAFTALGNNEHHPLRRYLTQIVDKCPPDWKRRSNAFRMQAAATNATYNSDASKAQHYDIKTMTQLHRRVISAVHYHKQITCRWNHLIKEVIEWEDVARNQMESQVPSPSRAFKSTLPKERSFIYSIYNTKMEWYWKCLIRVWILRIVGFTIAAFSVAVVWSEIAFPISVFSPKLSVFAYFVDNFQAAQQYFHLELFSIISLGYLAICAFYTVFHMKIYNIYYLAPNSQTDEYSLLFSGMLLCRLTAPLCLNYLCLVHRDSHIVGQAGRLETSFTTIMGHLDLIPFVNRGLNVFLPFCISAICLAIYFNFGVYVLHHLGFEQFIENDEMTIDWVQTGRELVKRETGKLIRNYESHTSTYHEMISANVNIARNENSSTPNRNDKGSVNKAESSPISLSSSSSGLSQSSLLPRGQNNNQTVHGNPAVAPNTARSHSSQPGQSQASNQSTDNVVQIDMTQPYQEYDTKKSTGFFDDV